MTIKTTKKAFSLSIALILLLFGEVFANNISILKHVDEALFVICSIKLLLRFLRKRGKVNAKTGVAVIVVILIIGLGLLENFINNIQTNWTPILIDIASCVKVFLVFFYYYETLGANDAMRIVAFFQYIAKAFLILATFFGLISLFVDLGMGGEVRFGIASFSFIFEHAHVFAIVVISSLLLIVIKENNTKKIYIYTALACVCQLLTTKGPSIIWSVIIFFLYHYYVKNNKIKPRVIVLISIVCILLGGYQINNYFLQSNAPRAILLKYGIITAKEYFPLGTGFGTFGSDTASKYYSPLYRAYGFTNLYGMGPSQGFFLNDNYWPMVMGQFGFLGLPLFGYLYYIILRLLQKVIQNRVIKACAVCNFIYIMIHSLGSASLTSSAGMVLFVVLAIALTCCKRKICKG